jgi:hypothetical protein
VAAERDSAQAEVARLHSEVTRLRFKLHAAEEAAAVATVECDEMKASSVKHDSHLDHASQEVFSLQNELQVGVELRPAPSRLRRLRQGCYVHTGEQQVEWARPGGRGDLRDRPTGAGREEWRTKEVDVSAGSR